MKNRSENDCKNLNLMFWFVKCLMTRSLNSLPFFANAFDINVNFMSPFPCCMCSRSFNLIHAENAITLIRNLIMPLCGK